MVFFPKEAVGNLGKLRTITHEQQGSIVSILLDRLAPGLIVLFGSAAKGQMFRPDSDIDLGFLRGSPIGDRDRLRIAEELSSRLGREVDLIDLGKADALLKYEIARDGVVLHQAGPHDFACFQVRAMQEQNDARKFYDLDKAYIREFLRGGAGDARPDLDSPQNGPSHPVS